MESHEGGREGVPARTQGGGGRVCNVGEFVDGLGWGWDVRTEDRRGWKHDGRVIGKGLMMGGVPRRRMRKNQQPQTRRGPMISRTAQRRDGHHLLHPSRSANLPSISSQHPHIPETKRRRRRRRAHVAACRCLTTSLLTASTTLHTAKSCSYHVTSPQSTVSGLVHQARRYPSPVQVPAVMNGVVLAAARGPRQGARRKTGGKEGSWAEGLDWIVQRHSLT